MSLSTTHLLPLYTRLAVSFVKGEGVWLYDENNKPYFDAISGLGVSALGHSHPQLMKAIGEQLKRPLHLSNGVIIPEQENLAARLCALSGMDKAFFCNSGAEANEAALKLIRLYAHQKNIPEPQVVVLDGAFHGRTLATLSANSSRKTQEGFEPLVSGFVRAPFHDLNALKKIAKEHTNIVAIMIEPVQGSGGIRPLCNEYLQSLRTFCTTQNWLLVIDEVQTGVGRTGAFYAYQHADILPDIVTSAKALANGIPIAACLTRGVVNTLFHEGQHGSTFGGNPFACGVSLAVLDIIEKERLIEKTREESALFLEQLKALCKLFPFIQEVRGLGWMIGIEFCSAPTGIRQLGLEFGLLLNITAQKVLRFMPPLTITAVEQRWLLKQFQALLEAYASRHSI